MTYIGMSWIDEDLRAAIADADDDQAAFALAATALIGTVRVGLGKVGVEVARLTQAQADTAAAMRELADAVRDVNVRSEDVGLVPAADYDPHYREGEGDRDVVDDFRRAVEPAVKDAVTEIFRKYGKRIDDEEDPFVVAPVPGGFAIGRRSSFPDEAGG